MTRLVLDISVSVDGFVAGPNPRLDRPLGEGGEKLHAWAYGLRSFRARFGMPGGATTPDSDVVEEHVGSVGATIMGRHMFSGGSGPWADDPNAYGWWGQDPPLHHPVFVLTHHPREPLTLGATTFTFVTDGIHAALEQARAAAGGKDVAVAGGADAVQQYLEAGLLDQVQLHLVPVFLGDGVRLFGRPGTGQPELRITRVVTSPAVTHLRYDVGT